MIKNDKMDYTTFYDFLYAVFTNLKRSTKQKAGIYVFYAHSQSRAFLNSFYDAGLKQRSIIIWYKKGGGFGDFMAQYMNAYEPCLFGTVGENNPIIYGSNGETVKWNGASDEKTIWELEKEKKCDLHPTMKPVALFQRAIRNSSQRGDTILDLFGGSGTTIIAAAGLGRKARVMEADPHFCDVIRKRWTAWAKDNGFEPGSGALT
jgi:DNA modification methylase